MTIEILDYKPQTSGSTLIGLFSVRFVEWHGLTVSEFRHCSKGDKEWVDFPLKFSKNADGSWDKPIARISFDHSDTTAALKRSIMQKIHELDKKPRASHEQQLPF